MISRPPDAFTADYRLLPTQGVGSLVWRGGHLLDWACGVRYGLDGSRQGPRVNHPFRFDAAIISPSEQFVALYERLGTSGVVRGPRGLERALVRYDNNADVYDYPIAFFRLADGREALVHCPDDYDTLRIEDPATGECWSEPGAGWLQSTFHSRLMANPTGTRLLSAGWGWHPVEVVEVFDLISEEDRPIRLLHRDGWRTEVPEVSSAIFDREGQVIVSTLRGAEDYTQPVKNDPNRPSTIAVYNLDTMSRVSLALLEEDAGTLMAVGRRHVLGLFGHPKLIELATGRVVHAWPEIVSGQQRGSICPETEIAIALDPVRGRFAVAGPRQIAVITLNPELLNL